MVVSIHTVLLFISHVLEKGRVLQAKQSLTGSVSEGTWQCEGMLLVVTQGIY